MRPSDLADKLKDRGHHQASDAISTLLLEIQELRRKVANTEKQADYWKARSRRLEKAGGYPHAVPHHGRVS